MDLRYKVVHEIQKMEVLTVTVKTVVDRLRVTNFMTVTGVMELIIIKIYQV